MSYPQFGYTYPSAASSSLTTPQLLVPGTSLATSIPTTCCETGRPITSEPSAAGQTMYSTSALLTYPRVAGLPDAMYSSAYATQGYVPFGADPSAFYSPLGSENTEAWRSLSQSAGWPYDPTNMAGYPYGTSYGGLDVRRKNATRESTSTLKAWLYEHIKNPYPTKGEKIMLAIITKMTLTQVSTWFANARRRLKKENKMQWSPRNRTGDDDKGSDDEDDDGEGEGKDRETNNNDGDNKEGSDRIRRDEDEDIVVDGGMFQGNDNDSLLSASDLSRDGPSKALEDGDHKKDTSFDLKSHLSSPLDSPSSVTDSLLSPHLHKPHTLTSRTSPGLGACASLSSNTDSNTSGPGGVSTAVGKVGQVNHLSEKPRIWSLADVATSSTPPMGRKSPLCLSSHSSAKPGTQTAFSSHPNPGFQPWMNGTYSSPSSHSAAGLSFTYPGLSHPLVGGNGTGQMAGSVGHRNGLGAAAMGGASSLATPSAGYSKLPNGFLGEKNDIPQLSSSFNTTSGDAQTAFKPVLKRV